MAADRVITCTNKDGDAVTFRETGFYPFLLVSAEGVYDAKNTVNLMNDTVMDGAIYQGSTTPFRNIVITVKDISLPKGFYADSDVYITDAVLKGQSLEIREAIIPAEEGDISDDTDELHITSAGIKNKAIEIYNALPSKRSIEGKDFVEHRQILDRVFKKGEIGHLSFTEYNQTRVIDYYVESVTSGGTHSARLHTISLICPDPFFYNPDEQKFSIGEFIPHFKFFHEFTAEGEEFGYFNATYCNIYNDTANENIGLTISIGGKASIVNPVLTRMESGDFIKLGTPEDPFTIEAGETVIITTAVGNKHVYLISGDTTTEINYRIAEGSKFIQLMRGSNSFYFNCDSGERTALIEITYRMQYARA